jgi:hypothetical protein
MPQFVKAACFLPAAEASSASTSLSSAAGLSVGKFSSSILFATALFFQ